MKYYNLFLESWRLLKNKNFLALFVIEFLFFLLLIVLVLVTVNSVSENIDELKTFQQEFTVDENASVNYLYENLLSLSNILDEIFKTVIIAFIALFFLSGFFNGILWKGSVNLINGKHLFKDYNKKYFLSFFLLTFIWFAIFAGIFYLLYLYGFSYGVFAVILILFFYFAWINFGYYVIERKLFNSIFRSVIFAIKKFYIFVPAFLLLAIILLVVSYLFGLFENASVSFLASMFLAFIFVWFRIFLIMICEEGD